MTDASRFCVVESELLRWPSDIRIPNERFRLFVAADVTQISTDLISEFARSALRSGMVYFCAWGPGCERFHDVVDEVVVEDELGERLFVGGEKSDTIMTTWHEDESLDEALDFYIMPSHIFARLGLWQDDINSNLAAIRVADSMAEHHHVMHHKVHSIDFLEYAYMQIGDDAGAKATIEQIAAIRPEQMDPEFENYLLMRQAEGPAKYASSPAPR